MWTPGFPLLPADIVDLGVPWDAGALRQHGHHGPGNQSPQGVGIVLVGTPLESGDSCCGRLQGLSLRNVELRIKNEKGRAVFQERALA